MKCCKTCKYAKWELTPRGNIRRDYAGRCEYRIELPLLPSCVTLSELKIAIWPDGGKLCPVWEENTGELRSR